VPVDRMLKLSERKALLGEAADMPKIRVTDADLATVYRLGDGTLSPLTGPMTKEQFELVLDERVVISNGKKYAWTIPLSLPVTDVERAKLQVGGKAALENEAGELVGILEVQSVFDWDKPRYVKSVYGTERFDHPGGAIVENDERTTMVGGDIHVLPGRPNAQYGHQMLSPLETRAMIRARKWEKALAFQTRNPLHRAHEYALVHGLQELTRAGHYAGAVLNPLMGQLKGDDVDAPTRMLTYNALKANRLLGEGDSDTELWDRVGYELNDVFELIGLDIKMFYGGPAEAVMHAIYRQNHGFSHIVIGRKHADAPYFDKTAIWGDFDAHAIFDELPGELHILPMKVGFAAYYDHMGRVDLMDNQEGHKAYFISGTKVRGMLVDGEHPPEKIMRRQTAEILINAYKNKG
jgi:sulfate adenylyltransferase